MTERKRSKLPVDAAAPDTCTDARRRPAGVRSRLGPVVADAPSASSSLSSWTETRSKERRQRETLLWVQTPPERTGSSSRRRDSGVKGLAVRFSLRSVLSPEHDACTRSRTLAGSAARVYLGSHRRPAPTESSTGVSSSGGAGGQFLLVVVRPKRKQSRRKRTFISQRQKRLQCLSPKSLLDHRVH